MFHEPSEWEDELERVIAAAAESVFEMSDEEVEAEVRAAGEDPEEVAEATRAVLLDAIDRHQWREPLDEARSKRASRLSELARSEHEPTGTPAENRALLAEIFHRRPHAAEMLTVHFRDLRCLPDADVASCLRQLAALGILDGSGGSEDEG